VTIKTTKSSQSGGRVRSVRLGTDSFAVARSPDPSCPYYTRCTNTHTHARHTRPKFLVRILITSRSRSDRLLLRRSFPPTHSAHCLFFSPRWQRQQHRPGRRRGNHTRAALTRHERRVRVCVSYILTRNAKRADRGACGVVTVGVCVCVCELAQRPSFVLPYVTSFARLSPATAQLPRAAAAAAATPLPLSQPLISRRSNWPRLSPSFSRTTVYLSRRVPRPYIRPFIYLPTYLSGSTNGGRPLPFHRAPFTNSSLGFFTPSVLSTREPFATAVHTPTGRIIRTTATRTFDLTTLSVFYGSRKASEYMRAFVCAHLSLFSSVRIRKLTKCLSAVVEYFRTNDSTLVITVVTTRHLRRLHESRVYYVSVHISRLFTPRNEKFVTVSDFTFWRFRRFSFVENYVVYFLERTESTNN